jgi:predicted nucleic acid-binding protein
MSLYFTSQLNDPDLDRVSAALLRAGQRARELARQSGTGIAVQIDGELRVLAAFAIAAGLRLISLDQDFRQFERESLTFQLLQADGRPGDQA